MSCKNRHLKTEENRNDGFFFGSFSSVVFVHVAVVVGVDKFAKVKLCGCICDSIYFLDWTPL